MFQSIYKIPQYDVAIVGLFLFQAKFQQYSLKDPVPAKVYIFPKNQRFTDGHFFLYTDAETLK